MQVYRGLEVLTNHSKRSTELVGIWDLDHEASVGEYAGLAHAAIDHALEEGSTPVVVAARGSICEPRWSSSICRRPGAERPAALETSTTGSVPKRSTSSCRA